jgi:hypothetical protein
MIRCPSCGAELRSTRVGYERARLRRHMKETHPDRPDLTAAEVDACRAPWPLTLPPLDEVPT